VFISCSLMISLLITFSFMLQCVAVCCSVLQCVAVCCVYKLQFDDFFVDICFCFMYVYSQLQMRWHRILKIYLTGLLHVSRDSFTRDKTRSYSQMQIKWHRILRLFLKHCQRTRILLMGFPIVTCNNMVLIMNRMRTWYACYTWY